MLQFVTGSKRKFEEIHDVLGVPMEQSMLELPEIQSLDAKEVISKKLYAARERSGGAIIVEDTSLYLDCLEGVLPGPFIKWFEKGIGIPGIVEITDRYGVHGAEVKTLIGYLGDDTVPNFFEGICRGTIVPSRGDKDFGWGPIFMPEGHTQTFGEMEREEKAKISMRGVAARNLKDFLKTL